MDDIEFMHMAILMECAFHPAYDGDKDTYQMGASILEGLANKGSEFQKKYAEAVLPLMQCNAVA